MTTLKFSFGLNGDVTWEPSSKLLPRLEREGRGGLKRTELSINKTQEGKGRKEIVENQVKSHQISRAIH